MKTLQKAFVGLVFFILYAPIIILMVYSFNQATYSVAWQGATLSWYQQLFNDSDLLTAAWHSVVLALSSSLTALLIGTIASVSFYHYRFLGRKVLMGGLFSLIIVPDILFASALLIFFRLMHITFGFMTLFIAHVSFCLPFVMLILKGKLKSLNKRFFDVASDLGAYDFIIIKRIIFPLLLSAMGGAFLLAFTLSFDDVLISYFVQGPDYEILPLKIYSLIRNGLTPTINALSCLIFLLSLITVCFSQYLIKRRT